MKWQWFGQKMGAVVSLRRQESNKLWDSGAEKIDRDAAPLPQERFSQVCLDFLRPDKRGQLFWHQFILIESDSFEISLKAVTFLWQERKKVMETPTTEDTELQNEKKKIMHRKLWNQLLLHVFHARSLTFCNFGRSLLACYVYSINRSKI